jgi:hypothetical protein
MTTVTAAPVLPPAKAWHTASYDRPCPSCGRDVKRGQLVAHVGALFARHVCAGCTSSPQPVRRQR